MFQRTVFGIEQMGKLVAKAASFGGRKDFHAPLAQRVSVLLKPDESREKRAHMQGQRVDREGVILTLDACASEGEQSEMLRISWLLRDRLRANNPVARREVNIRLRTRLQLLGTLER
jgi:hypothetical protein